jgi:acyl-lipid omega-6 desaturase (Delta-12 desaturase)
LVFFKPSKLIYFASNLVTYFMLHGKDLILATKPFAHEVRSKSWFHTLTAYSLLVVTLCGSVAAPYLILRITSSILAGMAFCRMFVIYHDHQHHAILNGSIAGNILMTIFGIYVLAPTSIWKRSHDYHHKHNSKLFSASIGSFPIATAGKFAKMSPAERRSYLASRHPLTILMGYISMFMVGMCVNSFRSSPRRHIDSLIALIIHIGGSIAIFWFWGWQAWLLGVFVPFFIAQGLGAYLFYVQHNFPGVTFANNAGWKYDSAALESSSYLRMNPFMQWVTANIGFHHIHHLNSRIPFYRLPEVMAALPELQHPKVTTFKLKDISASLKLKVWDEEKRIMRPL